MGLKAMGREKLDKVIGVVAGKGGVGKSTLAVNLALALAKRGKRVGMIDADIYGPSLQKLLGEESPPKELGGKIVPARGLGIDYVSAAFFHLGSAGAVVRAPIANQIISQFLEEVVWGDLDYLLIDFPPGSGDICIGLLQQVAFSGMVAVTTPQDVALLDVRKSIHMIHVLEIPLLGVVENMSYLTLENGERCHVFGSGGGERLAKEFHAPLLGVIPLDPFIAKYGDSSLSLFEKDHKSALPFLSIIDHLEKELMLQSEREGKCLNHFELIWNL